MKTVNLWECGFMKNCQIFNDFDEFMEYVTNNNVSLDSFKIKNRYNVMDEANDFLECTANKNNTNIIYTDENHSVIVSQDNTFLYINEDFFNRHKERFIEANNKLIEKLINDKYETIIFNKHYNNIEYISELLNKGIKCNIWIKDIEIPDDLLVKLRNSKINIKYIKDGELIQLSSCYAFGTHRYDELSEEKEITIYEELSDKELDNLCYVNENTIILTTKFLKKNKLEDYQRIEKLIEKLEMLGKKCIVKIGVDNRELFSKTNIIKHDYKNVDLIVHSDLYDYNFETYKKEEDKLNNLVKDIKDSEMSQFEKYIAVYNIVKNFKPYKENEDNREEARYLRYILDNDYMVCVGYARLFKTLLNKVGIEVCNYSVNVDASYNKGFTVEDKTVKKVGHARVIVNLKDDKYGINGYYISDPTWDNELDKDYLVHSAMTFQEEENAKRMFWNNDESYILGAKDFKEYNDRINTLMKQISLNKYAPTNDYKEIYAKTVDKIMELFDRLDNKYYQYLEEKYVLSEKLSKEKFDEKHYIDFLTEVGHNIVSKTNKKIDGKSIIEADMETKKQLRQVEIEKLSEYRESIVEHNKSMQSKAFPYEQQGNVWKGAEENKFEDAGPTL